MTKAAAHFDKRLDNFWGGADTRDYCWELSRPWVKVGRKGDSAFGYDSTDQQLTVKGTDMTQYEAAVRADKLIELLITHQPALFGATYGLNDPEDVANKLAQLRNALYVKMLPQAGQND